MSGFSHKNFAGIVTSSMDEDGNFVCRSVTIKNNEASSSAVTVTEGGDLTIDDITLDSVTATSGTITTLSTAAADGNVMVNTVRCMRVSVGTAASVSSTYSIPTGATILRCLFRVVTQYTATATLTVIVDGAATGDTALLTGEVLTDKVTNDVISMVCPADVLAVGPIKASIANTPAAGSGMLYIEYVPSPLG